MQSDSLKRERGKEVLALAGSVLLCPVFVFVVFVVVVVVVVLVVLVVLDEIGRDWKRIEEIG